MDKVKEIERFGKICCKTQMEVKQYVRSVLASNGYKVMVGDGYVYAKGELPYLVTAHMDTVHKTQCSRYSVHNYKGNMRIQSPVGIGGDDRCGVYMIVRMILDGYKPSVLFCEDEEIGSIGAGKFCQTKYADDLTELNYLIELDRANSNDAVFYDCDNPEFTKFILDNTGYEEAIGSWSDIVELSDESGIASVNLSCGYYKAHTVKEYVIFEEMMKTLYIVEKLLSVKNCKQYKFIRAKRTESKGYFMDDDFWTKYYDRYTGYGYSYEQEKEVTGMEISFNLYDKNGTLKEEITYVPGESEEECMYNFFKFYPDTCYNDIIDMIVY